jgi:mRNA interferase RelE/StbE
VSAYTVYITPAALREVRHLPGHVRQRAKRAIDDFQTDPRPPESRALDVSELERPAEIGFEVRRLRLDKWRILYAITEANTLVDVLAVRKRPPYDYGDLAQLLRHMGEKRG